MSAGGFFMKSYLGRRFVSRCRFGNWGAHYIITSEPQADVFGRRFVLADQTRKFNLRGRLRKGVVWHLSEFRRSGTRFLK